jgi:molybdate transport system regulatory protein
MQISTRNRLPGKITEVVKGEAAPKVSIRVGDNQLVALITRESADELGLEAGQEVLPLSSRPRMSWSLQVEAVWLSAFRRLVAPRICLTPG